ncbi:MULTISPECIES: GGDEF domain-containing phosphodiesterase [Actinoplanes]|uniref:putative bifunctional diguanylate cyclase/phosphodiesterase n=1 Tax=Actinoplanes TaxID=1865 RepID=UPI0005F2E9B8|nr:MULTISPECIES: GGDEF domain-containing phosphodiesterase [Actinoplanes]GLY06117.1 GGDEF-domain containing protein [Actinoplanes sp. NBRC 101535]
MTTARLIGTLALALGVVALGEMVPGPPRLYPDTTQLIAGLAAAGICLTAGRRRAGIPRRWRLLAAGGLLVWSLTRLWWVLRDLTGAAPAAPEAVGDVGFLVLPVCMLLGLLGATRTRPRPMPTSARRDQIALVLDSVLIAASLLALIWSVAPAGLPADLARTAMLAYPVADLVLLTMVVLLLTTRPDTPAGRRPLRLAGMALLAFTCGDTIRLLGSGPSWLENAGHLLGPVFLALAALSPARVGLPRPPAPLIAQDWFHLLLPYGPVVVAGVVLVARTLTGHPLTAFQAYLGWLGLALVVTRQMLTIVDNMALLGRVAETQRRLHHQAYHDPLTGLANRALFRERLVLALDAHEQHGAPVAVLFADLDDFKLINDTFGHAMGDRVLHAVGERMRACVRSQDLVARLGGDEFAVMLDHGAEPPPAPSRPPGRLRSVIRQRGYVLSAAGIRMSGISAPARERRRTEPEPAGLSWVAESEAIGQRILTALREPYIIDGRAVGVGASIGLVAAEPGDSLSADILLRRADAAMYAVKRRGKGALIRYTGPRDAGPNADLPQLLAGALTGGSPAASGFEVHYQPIVRLRDHTTVAVEALARWTDPVAGKVHPDVFVTMAERTGLVAAIDDFVLNQACADAAVLADRFGRPIAVHVNVSAGRLGQQGLEEAVAAALSRHDLPASRLVVEITETLRISDLPAAAAVVGRLRDQGVRVALDDFGSGFNALAQLHAIPVDIVKLDSTLTDVSDQPDDRAGALCRSVLAICAELGIDVVAEGIETDERSAALAGLGCPLGQGYLFGPPVAVDRLGL